MITTVNSISSNPSIVQTNNNTAPSSSVDFAQLMAANTAQTNTSASNNIAPTRNIEAELKDPTQGLGKWQAALNAILQTSSSFQSSLTASSTPSVQAPVLVMPPTIPSAATTEATQTNTLSASDIVAARSATVAATPVTTGPTSVNSLTTASTTASNTNATQENSPSGSETEKNNAAMTTSASSNYTSTIDMLSSRLALQTNTAINQKLTDIMSKL